MNELPEEVREKIDGVVKSIDAELTANRQGLVIIGAFTVLCCGSTAFSALVVWMRPNWIGAAGLIGVMGAAWMETWLFRRMLIRRRHLKNFKRHMLAMKDARMGSALDHHQDQAEAAFLALR